MMNKKTIALLLAVMLTMAACSPAQTPPPDAPALPASSSQAQPLSPMAQDLALLTQTLEKGHKNLFASITREQWQAEVAALEGTLPGMSDSDFYYSLCRLVALVGDAHTSLRYSDYSYTYKYLHALPFAVLPFGDGWHLAIAPEANRAQLGWLVTKINDTPIGEVFESAKSIISFDNTVWATQQFSNTINFLEALQYLGVAEKDAQGITLTVQKDAAAAPQNIQLQALTESEIMGAALAQLTPDKTPLTTPNGYYSAELLDKQTLFIQYNTCAENPEYPMSRFTQEVAEAAKEAAPTKIIIDLRYNSGGNSTILDPLISALKKLQATQEFTVYTLIGGHSFSSAIINAVDTVQELGATLVGTPTGGSVNGYGELQSFTLQSSPITVYYSTKYFELLPDYEKDSLYPDVAIEQTYANYMAGVDAEVAAVLAQK